MGIIWIIEVLNFFCRNVILEGLSNINNLQGFFIFELFVLTPKVNDVIQTRFKYLQIMLNLQRFFKSKNSQKNELNDIKTTQAIII